MDMVYISKIILDALEKMSLYFQDYAKAKKYTYPFRSAFCFRNLWWLGKWKNYFNEIFKKQSTYCK